MLHCVGVNRRIAEMNAGTALSRPVSLGYGYWQWCRYAFFASFFSYFFYFGELNRPGAGTTA